MEALVLTVHMLVAVSVIVLVLLQQGKGADTGASFGSGASSTVFGSQGSASFLGRLTAGLVAVFFVTSLTLCYLVKHKMSAMNTEGVPQLQSAPIKNHAPVKIKLQKPQKAAIKTDAPETGKP